VLWVAARNPLNARVNAARKVRRPNVAKRQRVRAAKRLLKRGAAKRLQILPRLLLRLPQRLLLLRLQSN